MRRLHPLNERADVRSEDATSKEELPSRQKKVYVETLLVVSSDVKSVKPTRHSLEKVKRIIKKTRRTNLI